MKIENVTCFGGAAYVELVGGLTPIRVRDGQMLTILETDGFDILQIIENGKVSVILKEPNV